MSPYETFQVPSTKNGYRQIVQSGEPLGLQGVGRIPEEGSVRPPPLNPLLHPTFSFKEKILID